MEILGASYLFKTTVLKIFSARGRSIVLSLNCNKVKGDGDTCLWAVKYEEEGTWYMTLSSSKSRQDQISSVQ